MASERFFRIVGKGRSGKKALTSSVGRFHDDESSPTSYVAPKLMTAWKEVTANLGTVRANPEAFQAFEIQISDPDIRDLTNDQRLTSLMVDPAPREGRKLAEEVREGGVDGFRYPSMRSPGDQCVVIFLENVEDRVSMTPLPEEEWMDFVEALE